MLGKLSSVSDRCSDLSVYLDLPPEAYPVVSCFLKRGGALLKLQKGSEQKWLTSDDGWRSPPICKEEASKWVSASCCAPTTPPRVPPSFGSRLACGCDGCRRVGLCMREGWRLKATRSVDPRVKGQVTRLMMTCRSSNGTLASKVLQCLASDVWNRRLWTQQMFGGWSVVEVIACLTFAVEHCLCSARSMRGHSISFEAWVHGSCVVCFQGSRQVGFCVESWVRQEPERRDTVCLAPPRGAQRLVLAR
jgi:hypothetical protein